MCYQTPFVEPDGANLGRFISRRKNKNVPMKFPKRNSVNIWQLTTVSEISNKTKKKQTKQRNAASFSCAKKKSIKKTDGNELRWGERFKVIHSCLKFFFSKWKPFFLLFDSRRLVFFCFCFLFRCLGHWRPFWLAGAKKKNKSKMSWRCSFFCWKIEPETKKKF